MKKISLFMAAVLISTSFISCGKKEESQEKKAPEVTQKTEETAPIPETKKEEVVAQKEMPSEKEESRPEEKAPPEEAMTEEEAGSEEEVKSETAQEVEAQEREVEEEAQIIEMKPKVPQGIDGRKLFSAKGCTVCHKEKLDTVGPSLAKISSKYNGDKGSLIQFFKGKHPAVVDPARYTMMKPQISITKNMSEQELNALADYILSIK